MAEENVNIKVVIDAAAAAKTLDDLKKAQADLNKELGKAAIGSDEFKKLSTAAEDTKGKINSLGDAGKSSFDKFTGGLKGSLKGFLDLGKAFLTNPIGLVITAITALIGYFSQFEAVTKVVSSVMGTLSAVFDGLVTNFIPILEALGKFLMGDFSGAAAGISEVAGAIEKQATAAWNLADAEDALDEAQTAQIVNLAKLSAEEDKLLQQAKNKTLSDEARIKLLEDSQKVAREAFEAESKLAEQELAVAEQRLAATTKGKNEYDALARAVAEAQAKVIGLEGDLIKREEKAGNQIDALNEAAAAKREAAAEKRRVAEEKAAEERKRLAEKEAAEFEKQIQKEIEAAKKLEEEKRAIAERDAASQLLQFNTALAQEQAYQLAKKQLQIDSAETPEAKLEAQLAFLAEEQAQKTLALQTEFDTKQAYDEAQLLLDEQYALKRKELNDAETAAVIANAEKEKAAKIAAAQSYLQSAAQFVTVLSQLSQASTDAQLKNAGTDEVKKEKIRKDAFEKQKKYSIAMALINGALAVVAAAATVPYIPLGIIAQVLAVGTTVAAVAKIASTQYSGGGSPMAASSVGGGAGDFSGAGAMPSLPTVQGQDFNQNAVGQAGGGTPQGGQNDVQVYVLESDISKTQNSVTNVQVKASWP